jgi:hypothetical protein
MGDRWSPLQIKHQTPHKPVGVGATATRLHKITNHTPFERADLSGAACFIGGNDEENVKEKRKKFDKGLKIVNILLNIISKIRFFEQKSGFRATFCT